MSSESCAGFIQPLRLARLRTGLVYRFAHASFRDALDELQFLMVGGFSSTDFSLCSVMSG